MKTQKNKADGQLPATTKTKPWCSVIIPTLNEAANLPTCLNALHAAAPAGKLEVIVVDGGSTDATVATARRLGARVINSPPGRARQLNAGAAVATSHYFYFLHADTLPPENWLMLLLGIKINGGAACFSIRFDRQEESRWLRLFSKLSRWDVDAFRFGDQSLFISRRYFTMIKGYREDHVLLEGHDIVRRLRASGAEFEVLPEAVTTSARRYLTHGVVFTQLVFVLIYGLYRLGFSQARLTSIYRWAFPARAPRSASPGK